MTEVFEFPPQERCVELFLYCVDQLKVDDDGLTADNDRSDLNAAAFMCHAIKALTIAPNNVADILLFQLADRTEELICTAVSAPEGDVVGRWLKARAEYLKCQLDGL